MISNGYLIGESMSGLNFIKLFSYLPKLIFQSKKIRLLDETDFILMSESISEKILKRYQLYTESNKIKNKPKNPAVLSVTLPSCPNTTLIRVIFPFSRC